MIQGVGVVRTCNLAFRKKYIVYLEVCHPQSIPQNEAPGMQTYLFEGRGAVINCKPLAFSSTILVTWDNPNVSNLRLEKCKLHLRLCGRDVFFPASLFCRVFFCIFTWRLQDARLWTDSIGPGESVFRQETGYILLTCSRSIQKPSTHWNHWSTGFIAESGMTMWMSVTKPWILRNVQHIAQKFACMLRNDSSSHLSHIRYHIILHDPDNTVCYTCSFSSWRTCTGSLHRHVSHRWVWYTANGCTTCFTYWVEVLQSGHLWHWTQLSGCWSCRLWPCLCNN